MPLRMLGRDCDSRDVRCCLCLTPGPLAPQQFDNGEFFRTGEDGEPIVVAPKPVKCTADMVAPLASAYALLRAFSWHLKLSPFSFPDLVEAICVPCPTPLMDEVHEVRPRSRFLPRLAQLPRATTLCPVLPRGSGGPQGRRSVAHERRHAWLLVACFCP